MGREGRTVRKASEGMESRGEGSGVGSGLGREGN